MLNVLRNIKEGGLRALFFACAALSVLTTAAIIYVLFSESLAFFRQVSLREFLLTAEWSPQMDRKFGVLPLLTATMLIAVGALAIAVPVGLITAIFLSEFAPGWLRGILKPMLEVLAGVPTVVYGFFAVTFVTPVLLRPLFPDVDTFNAASAAIVVGVMIIPTISSLSDDALRAVPRTLREAGYALAATKLEVSTRIVVPGALSGIVAAILLALARAVGETMAVALAAGSMPNLSLNPLRQMESMTAYIVRICQGETPSGTIEYQSIFAVGLTLFLMTLIINVVARRVLARFREAYE